VDHEPAAGSAREAVRSVVGRISAAWQSRRYDELAGCLDEDVVLVAPGFQERLEGRAAFVQSYREFMESATITKYKESPPAIDVWGDTAVASYRWEMSWNAAGTSNHEAGHDIFVLRREGAGDWRAVWRTMTVEPRQG
jgi:uncharacterized protein (TIGR02246 family)